MAREHARVKLSIWEDDDFRLLTGDAQRLYFVLMTHAKLDYCGVTDWRPARLAPFCADWTVDDVERAAQELSEALYLVIDTESEEALIRSFIRSDELLESPNMAVAMRKAHAAVASGPLRAIVVHELNRLHKDKPDLKGWPRVSDLLDRPSMNPSDYPSFKALGNPSRKGSDNPSFSTSPDADPNPSVRGSAGPSPTTAPTPAPPSKGQEQGTLTRGSRLVDDWKPTEADVTWQREKGISDLLARRQLENFVLYWTNRPGKDGVKLDWSKTWRRWLLTEQDRVPAGTRPTQPSRPNGWEFGMDR